MYFTKHSLSFLILPELQGKYIEKAKERGEGGEESGQSLPGRELGKYFLILGTSFTGGEVCQDRGASEASADAALYTEG